MPDDAQYDDGPGSWDITIRMPVYFESVEEQAGFIQAAVTEAMHKNNWVGEAAVLYRKKNRIVMFHNGIIDPYDGVLPHEGGTMKITIKEPDGPYSCEIDPGVMNVNITEAFLGVGFTTKDDQRLSVCMRDDGYEVRFNDEEWVEFKPGSVNAR